MLYVHRYAHAHAQSHTHLCRTYLHIHKHVCTCIGSHECSFESDACGWTATGSWQLVGLAEGDIPKAYTGNGYMMLLNSDYGETSIFESKHLNNIKEMSWFYHMHGGPEMGSLELEVYQGEDWV